jgi:valyl-tRNA synthetase
LSELSKAYNPKAVEEKWYAFWEEKGYFKAKPNPQKKPYTIVIPPPNVTGILTVGHVLNNTIQDILVRFKRMEGFETLWLPGMDHAGIATQVVVEKELAKEGKTRQDLGREAFVRRVWEWKEQYGGIILKQLKRLGCSCDWARERFTMDTGLSEAVLEVFVRLYEKGLVYRGKRIVNWCPRCRTAISDEQVEHIEKDAKLYYVRYPYKEGGGFLTVATTRPETILGDVALAVHPEDERYKAMVGKMVLLPVLERELPVIGDPYVDKEFGTGALKITPAHDPADFDIGQRHKLPSLNILAPDATINELGGPYQGLTREECQRKIIVDLEAKGLLEKTEPYHHAVGQCERCETVIEPYLSEQWFVDMRTLASPALKAVLDGEITFFPERWTKVYQHWMENIQPWCISRQLWWGHRIPIYTCDSCSEVIVRKETPKACPKCGGGPIRQDEDVLDTWFSSWLWPFSTLGWPQETPDLEYFYPTDMISTAPDIIFLWIARMIMAGYEFRGKKPFSSVYYHSTIRDEKGRRMSKSLGNSPDPLDLFEQYGTDAVRFTIISLAPIGQDILFAPRMVEMGRNFANKLWNAARFVLMQPGAQGPLPAARTEDLRLEDRWLLSRFHQTVGEVREDLEGYKFNEVAKALYDFVWHDYCDWYIEMAKPRLAEEGRETVLGVLLAVLEGILRMLHPFMPFLTEEIWQQVPHKGESIMISPYPKSELGQRDENAEQEMALLQEIITGVRNIRAEMGIGPQQKVDCHIKVNAGPWERALREQERTIRLLAKAEALTIGQGLSKPKHSATAVIRGCEVYVPLEGLLDLATEKARLDKEANALERLLAQADRKLSDPDFREKAPAEINAREAKKRDDLREKRDRLLAHRAMLEE